MGVLGGLVLLGAAVVIGLAKDIGNPDNPINKFCYWCGSFERSDVKTKTFWSGRDGVDVEDHDEFWLKKREQERLRLIEEEEEDDSVIF